MALSWHPTLNYDKTMSVMKAFGTKQKKMAICYSSRFSMKKERARFPVVAMNPALMTEPVTKEDLVQFFASGCKPKDQWRVGTEFEKFGYDLTTLRPLKYEQLKNFMNVVSERFNWDKIIEAGLFTGLKQGKKSITLEPGCQLELSGAPVETLHETCEEIHSHILQIKSVAMEMNMGFMGGGFLPNWTLDDIPKNPKVRCQLILDNMSIYSIFGVDVSMRACTVQANLDFSSEQDMIMKYRASLSLQPIATAIFASSPFKEGKPSGYLTTRSYSWSKSDRARCGIPSFVFDDSFGFEAYVDYAMDLTMYCVSRNNKTIDCRGTTFRDFMQGKLPQLPGERPTLKDWEEHLGFVYPEARLKKYIEMRGADCGSLWSTWAVPAFWVGLLYDEVSLQNVADLTADWTNKERQMLHQQVPISGLKTPFRGGILRDVAQEVVKIAKNGLERRGYNEARFLKEVIEVVATGTTQAEKLLGVYHEKCNRNIDRMFAELSY